MKTMITLFAEEGMVLTDGESYGTTMQLAIGMSADKIREIPLEEYNKTIESEEVL